MDRVLNSVAHEVEDVPGRLDTYALTYAIGIAWLLLAMVLLGAQKTFAFDGIYDALLTLPPLATALGVLVIDRRSGWLALPLNALLLATVCGIASALSTVLLTPFLVLMFRERITGNLGLTGAIASVVLIVVVAPVAVALVRALKAQTLGRVFVLAIGLVVAGVALAMTLDPTGALASSMRLDQARIMMVAASWLLPFYALTAAYVRSAGLV